MSQSYIPLELRQRVAEQARHRCGYCLTSEAIVGAPARFHGRERDVSEVRNYWNALLRVEEWAAAKTPLTEDLVRRLHALLVKGKRARPTPYRDGQNVIRDSASGGIVYLPPEAHDVPALMAALVAWIHQADKDRLPVPLMAGLAHYQFVTVHPHHNYYKGHAEADLTPWLEYFIKTLAGVFTAAREEAQRYAAHGTPVEPEALRRLDHRARTVLALFARQEQITTADVAFALGLSARMARVLQSQWVGDGWLVVLDASRRKRAYALSADYRQFIGSLSAMTGNLSAMPAGAVRKNQ